MGAELLCAGRQTDMTKLSHFSQFFESAQKGSCHGISVIKMYDTETQATVIENVIACRFVDVYRRFGQKLEPSPYGLVGSLFIFPHRQHCRL